MPVDSMEAKIIRSVAGVVAGPICAMLLFMFSIMFIGNVREPGTARAIFSFVAVLVCGGLGGYLTARIAKRSEIVHALIAGLLLAAFGILMIVEDPSFQFPYKLNLAIFSIPAFAAGAYGFLTDKPSTE